MKKIIFLISILISSNAYSQCIIGGTTLTGTTKAKKVQACEYTIQGMANSMLKISGGVITPAIAGTDYALPFEVSDLFANGGNTFTSTASLGSNSNNSLAMKTNSIERLRIDSTGRINIGVTSAYANSYISSRSLGSTSSTYHFTLKNLSNTTLATLSDNGVFNIKKILVTGTEDEGTPDAAVRLSRVMSGHGGSGHGFADYTDYREAGTSYAAFDVGSIINHPSAGNFGHLIGFQFRGGSSTDGDLVDLIGFGDYGRANSSLGSISNLVSFQSQPVNSVGASISNRYGLDIYDVTSVNTNVGIYIRELNATSLAASIYSNGVTKGYHRGYWGLNTTFNYLDANLHVTGEAGNMAVRVDDDTHAAIFDINNNTKRTTMHGPVSLSNFTTNGYVKTTGGTGVISVGATIPGADVAATTQSPGNNTTALATTEFVTTADNLKQDNITLTTFGTSGAAMLIGSTLNIPDYSAGGGATDITISQTPSNVTVNSSNGLDGTITLANGTNAGVSINNYTTAEQAKLSGIATGATANSSDATLLNRANHTGTQDVSTITGLGALATQPVASVVNGGTGATAHTGLVIGNGTSAMTSTTTSAGLAGVLTDETGALGGFMRGAAVKLGADYTNATTTGTEITGLQIGSTGTGLIRFEYYLIVQSSVATTGLKFGINHTGTATVLALNLTYPSTGTTATTGIAENIIANITGSIYEASAATTFSTAAPNLGPIAGVAAINTNILMKISGVINVTVSGDLEIYEGSETAATTRVMANSSVIAFGL
jgi:hypothetical protein